MKRTTAFLLALVLALAGVAQAQNTQVLLKEDFEGLPLGPNVDEATPGDEVWTDIPPAGWINDASGVPGIEDPSTDGVTEWAGWGFADKEWWTEAAGDQNRSEYDLGQGTVAIADPDEWDDSGHPKDYPANTYDVWLSTCPIDLSTTKPGTVQLKFDSSWRPEHDDDYHQSAKITVSFDGGEPVELMLWLSDSGSANYKDYATNETVTLDIDNPAGAMNMVITFGLFDAGNDWWWAIDNILVTGERSARLAYNPNPAHQAVEVSTKPVLSWTPGEYASGSSPHHKLILSDDLAAVEDGTAVIATQDANSFDATGLLDFSSTYYWRIDEANSVKGWDEGNVWSFTTEAFVYPIEGVVATSNADSAADAGPENTVDGSGLNADDQHSIMASDMWLGVPGAEAGDDPVYIQYEFNGIYKLYEMLIWNYNSQFEPLLGFGLKNVMVEYSEDGATWTALGEMELARATAKPDYASNTTIAFNGVAAKYVRLTVNNGWGPIAQYGLSEVRFLYIPANARGPEPADGATDVSVETPLAWRAGREAVSHDVSLGTDADALASLGSVTDSVINPGPLDLGATYYWRVDEVNEADEIPVWQGRLWSFETQAFVVVDDFESYNDEDNLIYETWADGWINDSGSTVGYMQAPFAETTIVHDGKQAMPLFYDNSSAATSEVDLELSQDWSASGIKSLSLYFHGDLANSGGQLYVKIDNTKVVYDGPAVSIRRPSWQLWSIDLSTVGNVSNVNKLTIGVEGAGATGVVYIDDIGLYAEVLDYLSPDVTGAGDTVKGVPDDGDWPDAEYPDLAIDDDSGTKYLHRKGGSMATGFQVEPMVGATVVTGLTFTTANDDYGRDPIAFEFSGSNASIDGPYTLIASGDIVDFGQDEVWPRFSPNETPIEFENTVAYKYYQIVFPTLRPDNDGLMQIAEVELIGSIAP